MRPSVPGSRIVPLIGVLFCAQFAASASAAVIWNKVYTGFSSPVEVTNAHDGSQRLFVVQQTGKVLVIKAGAVLATPFIDLGSGGVDVTAANGEQGLLGIAFHPQFATNRQFYVNYSRKSDGATVIARYRASAGNADVADPLSGTVLLTIAQPEANHNGGAIKFGPDGYLYIGMGDGGGANDQHGAIGNGQDRTTLLGKILRIDVDNGGANPYAIPPGNPFAVAGGQKEIFAVGVRNPWRMSFDRQTGDFWFGDVGQGAVEEVDMLPAGTGAGFNFGWRIMEGTSCTGLASPPVPCNDPSLTPPVLTYTHAVGCSVTGGYVYRGAAVPALAGQYLYGDYCSGRIWAAQKAGNGPWTATELAVTGHKISTFGENEAGELYFADYAAGDIYQFADSGGTTPVLSIGAMSLAFGNVTVGAPGVSQTFMVTNAGAGTLTLATLTAGGLNPGDFARTGTCANGTALAASQSCTVTYLFTPAGVGARSANLAIASNAGNATITFAGTGIAPAPAGMVVSPASLDFGEMLVGNDSGLRTITVRNTGAAPLTLTLVAIQGGNPGDFVLAGSCAPGISLAAGAACTMDVRFHPLVVGARAASLVVASGGAGTSTAVALTGIGATTTSDAVAVIEYYHAVFDHYFITSLPQEIAALDSGRFDGWARTGKTFRAWSAAHATTSPVCRFYMPPVVGDSHFFSASPIECSDAPIKFPIFVFESAAVMHEILPEPATGACPANTVPIYRVWNRRADSNHRYVSDRTLRDSMVARGYVAEGYGPDAVGMCGPP